MADIALIISTEPENARILRDYLAYSGYAVHIDDGSEPLSELIDHLRPRLALVDVDHRDGFSTPFIEQAQQRGVVIVAFSPSRYESEVRQRAAPRHLAFVGLPLRVNRLEQVLRAVLPES